MSDHPVSEQHKGLVRKWILLFKASRVVERYWFSIVVLLFMATIPFLRPGYDMIGVLVACMIAVAVPLPKRFCYGRLNNELALLLTKPDYRMLISSSDRKALNTVSEKFSGVIGAHFTSVGIRQDDSSYKVFFRDDGFSKPLVVNRGDYLVRTLETERRIFAEGIVSNWKLDKLISRGKYGRFRLFFHLWLAENLPIFEALATQPSQVEVENVFPRMRETLGNLKGEICVPILEGEQMAAFLTFQDENQSITHDPDLLVAFSKSFWKTIKEAFSGQTGISPINPKPIV